jgi:hypothetical protein
MTTWWGRLWKRWPHEAENDGRILLRIGDRLYERRLVRIEEGPELAPLLAEASRKYLEGREIPMEAVTSGTLWVFELAPRSQGASGAQGAGAYQIGEVQARSWMLTGRPSGIGTPSATASRVLQRGVGISITRA